MTTFASRIQKAYFLFVHSTNSLQSLFLLCVRLYWGWQFAQTGWGKLHSLPHVVEYFTSLGIPAPALNAYFVSGLEFVGGILLALGLGGRLIALPLTIDMIVAYIAGDRAALMSFFSDPDKFSAAAPFTYLMASLIVLIFGSGLFSFDWFIERWWLRDSPGQALIESKWLARAKHAEARQVGFEVSPPTCARDRRLCCRSVHFGLASGLLRSPSANDPVCGSNIDVRFEGEAQTISRDDLLNWIKRAATAVCTYYGKYPVPI